MKFKVVLEHDAQGKSVCATVPGLPIVVDADSEAQAIQDARIAIRMWLDQNKSKSVRAPDVELVTVEV